MAESAPSLMRRLAIAVTVLWRILKDPAFAGEARRLHEGSAVPPIPEEPARLEDTDPGSALLLLGLLQREGRLIDFLQQEVAGYSDQELGATARLVHRGCREALAEHLTIEPVRSEPEGSRVTLPAGFDSSSVRPTGNLVGGPPFTGRLVHRGWHATRVRLPQVSSGHDLSILATAEVEL